MRNDFKYSKRKKEYLGEGEEISREAIEVKNTVCIQVKKRTPIKEYFST